MSSIIENFGRLICLDTASMRGLFGTVAVEVAVVTIFIVTLTILLIAFIRMAGFMLGRISSNARIREIRRRLVSGMLKLLSIIFKSNKSDK